MLLDRVCALSGPAGNHRRAPPCLPGAQDFHSWACVLLTGCGGYTLFLKDGPKRAVVPKFVPTNAPPGLPGAAG